MFSIMIWCQESGKIDLNLKNKSFFRSFFHLFTFCVKILLESEVQKNFLSCKSFAWKKKKTYLVRVRAFNLCFFGNLPSLWSKSRFHSDNVISYWMKRDWPHFHDEAPRYRFVGGWRMCGYLCRRRCARATPASGPFISVAWLLEVRRNNKLEPWQPLALAHLRGPCISLRVSSPMMRAVRGFLTS